MIADLRAEIKICFTSFRCLLPRSLFSLPSPSGRLLLFFINNLSCRKKNEPTRKCSELMRWEGRTLLINKGLPYWSVSFCIPIYEIYVALFLPAPRLRLLILSDFFLVGSLFSLAPFFALFAQNNNLYEMSKKREAFGVNIPKQNCLKTAFDMRDSCCCF